MALAQELKKLDVDFLKSMVLFRSMTDIELQALALKFEIDFFEEGDPVFLEGDPSQKIHFIYLGNVEIVKKSDSLDSFQRIRKIGRGEHMSEFSVLTNSPHSTSCFALEETQIYTLDGENFKDILSLNPKLTQSLLVTLSNQVQGSLHGRYYAREFDPKQIGFETKIMDLVPLEYIVKAKLIPIKIVHDCLHIAMTVPFNTSYFSYFEENISGYRLQITTLTDEEFERFRPLYLKAYHGEKVPQLESLAILEELKSEESFEDFFSFSLILSQLGDSVVQQIKPYLELKCFETGEHLFSPNEEGKGVYVLKSGQVLMTKKVEEHPLECHVETKESYDIIGESSMLSNRSHSLHAVASGVVQAYFMPKQVFTELLKITAFSLPLAMTLANRLKNLNKLEGTPLNFGGDEAIGSMTEMTVVDPNIKYIASPTEQLDITSVDSALGQIIETAISTRTSDIHLEHTDRDSIFRFRIDGRLAQIVKSVPLEVGFSLVNRIKILSKLDITEKRRPQDGQFVHEQNKVENVEVRVSTAPTRYGEKVVLRILQKKKNIIPITMLSHEKGVIRFLNKVTKYRQGLFLIAGPTGSGKTTTLYSVLGHLDHNVNNIVTLEDPVELDIPGVNQIQVDSKVGLSFSKMLRHVLRQDPDIILIGEIRDEESLRLAFEASLTGHLVLATIHATNSLDIFPRMLELGAKPSQVATSMVGVMTQRLIRVFCDSCKASRPITMAEIEVLQENLPNLQQPTRVNYGKGCEKCKGTGYHGRTPLFEYWENDPLIREMMIKNEPAGLTASILQQKNFKTLSQYGYYLVIKGVTSIEEVNKTVFGL